MSLNGNANLHSSRQRIIRAGLIGLVVGALFVPVLYFGLWTPEAYLRAWLLPNAILACLSASTTAAIIATSGKSVRWGWAGSAIGGGLATGLVLAGLGLELLRQGQLLRVGLASLLGMEAIAAFFIAPALFFGALFGRIVCYAGDAVDIIITEARPNNPARSTVARTIGVACTGVLSTFYLWGIVATYFSGRL